MFTFTLTFLLGICTALHLAALPNLLSLIIIFITILILFFILLYKKHPLLRHRGIIFIFALVLGFCWASLYISWQLHRQHLPDHLEDQKMSTEGYIASIPAITNKSASFLFQTTTINYQPKKLLFKVTWHWQETDMPQKIYTPRISSCNEARLTASSGVCTEAHEQRDEVATKLRLERRGVYVGDKWKFRLKVKRPHDMANPGSFSTESWALENHLSASGYILEGAFQSKRHWHQYPIDHARESLLALLVGIRFDLTPQQWDVLQRSGTNHLMAIAGLHIGMVATFLFFMSGWLWRAIYPLPLILPAQQFAAYLSLCGSLFYSLLVGFSLPTRRAMIMLGVVLLANIFKRNLPFIYSLLLALLIIIIIDPLATLSISFWLSFIAVGIIIYGTSGRIGKPGWWHHTVNIQWQIFIGLIPITILFFNGISLISPLANIVTIPWLGLVILPLIILGALTLLFSATMTYFFWHLAMKNLTWLWTYLDFLVNQPFLSIQYIPSVIPHNAAFLLLTIAAILFITPRGFWGKYLALLLTLPLITWRPPLPPPNTAWFMLLDVGQGLSAVIQTRHHLLIFDTGAKFSDNYDIGNSIIVPFLHAQHIKKIDTLMISHEDNDHIGGAKSLLNKFPVQNILTSVPEYFAFKYIPRGLPREQNNGGLSNQLNQNWYAQSCHKGQHWHWDGVEFAVLSPEKNHPYEGNDSSCVLKISVGKNSVLLTGDISKNIEQYLVRTQKENLSASILVASHHGSKTSSSNLFLETIHPQYILFATGYRNRFNFPNQEVVSRSEKLGIKPYNTAATGMLTFILNGSNYLAPPYEYRITHKKIWY